MHFLQGAFRYAQLAGSGRHGICSLFSSGRTVVSRDVKGGPPLIDRAAGALGGYAGAGPTFRLLTIRVPATAAAFDRRDTFVRT